MAYKQMLVMVASACLVAGQRPSFAGTKPIGFPDVTTPADPLGNRFGDDTPLPVQANGDRALIERLSKLPIDQQPFWFINWKAVEQAQKNPQTYPQRENSFTDKFPAVANQPQSTNSQSQSTNPQSNPPNSQSNSAANSDLTSKFGETNNGASGNFASNSNNFSSTSSNNRPVQPGYRQYGRRNY